ncbi:MAG: enoyl-CoA hydratase/isomerase family protein [Propionibacteriaceae bacterium]|nr:enoyl-CoA hydratase/isomerase family protein [Propionibacteriaceae bacterium]
MSDVLVSIEEGIGRIHLNRPRAINALTAAMLATITAGLTDFAADPAVIRVELTGEGERGLCAGADVRQLRQTVLDGGDPAEFLRTEYILDLAIARYPKPYRALMHGITMGGGMGIAAHGSDRVVTETSRLAMPETQIGLFPDVLMTWWLSRMPGEVGTHLALTGDAVNAADALWLGLADRGVGGLPPAELAADHDWISQCYAGTDPVEIAGRLAEHPHPSARRAAATLRGRSPLSIHVTLAALRRAATMSLEEVAEQDLRICAALALGPDFAEGVRAQLIDRDRDPRWSHASLSDVAPSEVAAFFPAAVDPKR